MKFCPKCGEEYEVDQKFCSKDGATLTVSGTGDDSLVGKVIAGRFQVLRKLGEGGMGEVFLVEHLRMQRKCALKVMRPHLATAPDAISRFNREANNASHIEHPNVATIYDFGDADDGMIYLAMEYIDGQSLSAAMDNSTPLPPHRVASIVHQVADGLQAAHDQGIWHRDLKPDNIMLKRSKSGADVVKIVDFGISKVGKERAQDVTGYGAFIGTPAYMSPEQFTTVPLDARSDVFALGLVTFRMLTGSLPFSGESMIDSIASRMGDPRTLSEVRHDLGWTPELELVMARVLATDRERRYSSAPEFAREFEIAVRAMPQVSGANDATLVFIPPSADMVTGSSDSSGGAVAGSSSASVTRASSPILQRVAIGLGVVTAIGLAGYAGRDMLSPGPAPVPGVEATRRNSTAPPAASAPSTPAPVATAVAAKRTRTDSAAGMAERASSPALRLAALEPQTAGGGVTLRFADNKADLTEGDLITFRVRSERGGYVTIVDVGPDGVVTVLHPHSTLDVGPIAANQEVVFPGPADSKFPVSLPAGTGVVRAFITEAPLAIRRSGDVANSRDDPGLLANLERVMTKQKGAWSTQSLAYTVRVR